MQYLLQIYNEEKNRANRDKKEQEAVLAEYRAFGKEFAKAIKGGDALQPTSAATMVRVRNGKRLTTDGPFAETKEQLGGYYLVDARDLDEAIAMAAKIPAARHGSIEVRPIQKFS
jgi:hypothetical protein